MGYRGAKQKLAVIHACTAKVGASPIACGRRHANRLFATTILSASLMIIAFVNLAYGLIPDTLSWGRRESRFLRYNNLALPVCVES